LLPLLGELRPIRLGKAQEVHVEDFACRAAGACFHGLAVSGHCKPKTPSMSLCIAGLVRTKVVFFCSYYKLSKEGKFPQATSAVLGREEVILQGMLKG